MRFKLELSRRDGLIRLGVALSDLVIEALQHLLIELVEDRSGGLSSVAGEREGGVHSLEGSRVAEPLDLVDEIVVEILVDLESLGPMDSTLVITRLLQEFLDRVRRCRGAGDQENEGSNDATHCSLARHLTVGAINCDDPCRRRNEV